MAVIHQRSEAHFQQHLLCVLRSPPQTREQEELEELLLMEQKDNEQRRLDLLQEEQRQLQAKKKNKQALLDELVRNVLPGCFFFLFPLRCFVPHEHTHTHIRPPTARGFMTVTSLKAYYQSLWCGRQLFSFCDSKASWLHCFELRALEVIVPAEWAAEGPSLIAR